MKKVKLVIGRIFLVAILIIGILGVVSFISYLNSYGENHTDEYSVYTQVESIQNLDELRSKLKELNLEYSIKDSTLKIKDNSFVSFDIKRDNTCQVCYNEYIEGFKKLDEEDRSVVGIYGISHDGKIEEKIVFKDSAKTVFTKIDNQYFTKSISFALFITVASAIISAISLMILSLEVLIFIKQRKSSKIRSVQ